MNTEFTTQKLSLDELCGAVGLTKRTVRYYIGLGLVDRPHGETKGAFYTDEHLQQLARVKTLADSGVSLDRIAQLLEHADKSVIQTSTTVAGQLSVKSHIFIAPGVELVIDGSHAMLSPTEIRSVARAVIDSLPNRKESS
jgi:DNA-binding transcriptional MerR regulator